MCIFPFRDHQECDNQESFKKFNAHKYYELYNKRKIAFAVFSKDYPESESKIEELLKTDFKKSVVNFTEILKIAKKEKHPKYKKLKEYAMKIAQVDE